jgi:hypothetical protein
MTMDAGATDTRSVAGDDGRIARFPDVDEQLSRLIDVLAAIRIDLTTGVMPRAARITGTVDRWHETVDHVDAAIQVARNVVIRLQGRA